MHISRPLRLTEKAVTHTVWIEEKVAVCIKEKWPGRAE